MSCPDLCTAAKCQELEARIGALEQALELIEAAFEAHVNQQIPEAHQYFPYVKVDLDYSNETLSVFVAVDDRFDTKSVVIPQFEPFVTFDIFPIENNSYVFKVQVNGDSDEDTLTLPESNLKIDGSFAVDTLNLTVADGESFDTAAIVIPLPEPTEHSSSNLKISASFFGDILTISIADGESEDTAQVYIDADVINNFGGGGNVSCDGLSQEIQDCCAQILAAIDNLSNQVQQVENEITIDITDTINTDYQCVENPETKALEPQLTPTSYSNKGLLGLHEHLKLMNANLDAIFKPLCDVSNETVVSIVASPKYVTNIEGKVLILHFVNLDAYPKRSSNQSLRPIQIPGARETYDWLIDFIDLRWVTGNQYGELQLEGYKAKVSGWFADEAAGNSYFDAVLNLTTAIEVNRNFPKHSNPQTNIVVRETRPYRAFIESVDETGTAICHAKYVPVEPQSNGN